MPPRRCPDPRPASRTTARCCCPPRVGRATGCSLRRARPLGHRAARALRPVTGAGPWSGFPPTRLRRGWRLASTARPAGSDRPTLFGGLAQVAGPAPPPTESNSIESFRPCRYSPCAWGLTPSASPSPRCRDNRGRGAAMNGTSTSPTPSHDLADTPCGSRCSTWGGGPGTRRASFRVELSDGTVIKGDDWRARPRQVVRSEGAPACRSVRTCRCAIRADADRGLDQGRAAQPVADSGKSIRQAENARAAACVDGRGGRSLPFPAAVDGLGNDVLSGLRSLAGSAPHARSADLLGSIIGSRVPSADVPALPHPHGLLR